MDHASHTGLSSQEAARRLQQHGRNEIRRMQGESALLQLARQLIDPLALLLWAAAAVSLIESSVAIAVVIVAVIVLNAGFAFAQELQAERATEALQSYLPHLARVRRDGEVVEIDAALLVPGDVVLVDEGDRISADARILQGAVEVDASAMTGESHPVVRSSDAPVAPAAGPVDATDRLFAGTLCVGGDAVTEVVATGMGTQLGRIAALSQRVETEMTPLQQQVRHAAKLIVVFAVVGGIGFFLAGTLAAGLTLTEAGRFAIGLLVANVPEGLLPTITLALAVGARRMARRKALIKRLAAVETLGSTDVICTDKTGTITEGDMTVVTWWSDGEERAPGLAPEGDDRWSRLLRTAVRCNNATLRGAPGAWERAGDPTESALLVAAVAAGVPVAEMQDERDDVRRRLLHFDGRLKRMTSLDAERDGTWWHAKGAPLELLERCTAIAGSDGPRPLQEADRTLVRDAFDGYAAAGLRVLGLAERRSDGNGDGHADRDAAERDLTFLGLVALEDPPREGVAEAVARCRAAGLRIIVITGDHGPTAAAIARQVGIVTTAEAVIVAGAEIDAMAEPELAALLDRAPELIIARSNPETKLRVVDVLREQGHVVAMTGDGVNDAPALRRADIGVAMGRSGTEVAREASVMVLTDDSFASIALAVEEGRVVYDNLGKFITYVFAHLPPEVVPFLIYALAGGAIPLPLTALQILAIDLGTETLPALALGREPAEPGVMSRPPRPRGSHLIHRGLLIRAWLWLGMIEAALVAGAFFWVLGRDGWSPGDDVGAGTPLHDTYVTATTMTFAAIVACQVGAAFACRTDRVRLREVGVLSNRLLLAGIAFELVFAAAVVYVPPLQEVFDTAALGPAELLPLAAFPLVVWGAEELRKIHVARR